MNTNTLRRSCLCFVLLVAMTSTIDGISADRQRPEPHAGRLAAQIKLPDGTTQSVAIDGVGCSISICSRVFIRAKSSGTTTTIPLDSLVSVTDVSDDSALFVTKDGTRQRLSFIGDFRVLYLKSGSGQTVKLDLSKIRSLQMVRSAK